MEFFLESLTADDAHGSYPLPSCLVVRLRPLPLRVLLCKDRQQKNELCRKVHGCESGLPLFARVGAQASPCSALLSPQPPTLNARQSAWHPLREDSSRSVASSSCPAGGRFGLMKSVLAPAARPLLSPSRSLRLPPSSSPQSRQPSATYTTLSIAIEPSAVYLGPASMSGPRARGEAH